MPRADVNQEEVTLRTCVRCGYTAETWKFPRMNIQFGKAYYRKFCKPCYNKRQLEWKATRNAAAAGEPSPTKPAARPWPYPPEE